MIYLNLHLFLTLVIIITVTSVLQLVMILCALKMEMEEEEEVVAYVAEGDVGEVDEAKVDEANARVHGVTAAQITPRSHIVMKLLPSSQNLHPLTTTSPSTVP
ncbi:hypothetical protein C8R48DRAFT_677850 [Suillus tomentosus]|nr:hypothetical protein C8R48DRAFT_677850 [Suillus tomentosus]